MYLNVKIVKIALLALAVAVIPTAAFAASELSFSVNGGATQTFACATDPCINTFTDVVDGVSASVSVGFNTTTPIILLDLTNATATTTAPVTVAVDYSVNGLTGGTQFAQSFAGTLNGSDTASFTEYFDAGNTLDALTTPVNTLNIGSGAPFLASSANATGAFAFGAGPYSLTNLYTLTITNPNQPELSQLNGAFAVPEPATLSLLGIGLLGLGAGLRRKLAR